MKISSLTSLFEIGIQKFNSLDKCQFDSILASVTTYLIAFNSGILMLFVTSLVKAYINKGTNNQSSISFFATATATLNHTKRISVTEVIENGGIEIIQDLDANYQAKLSHIEIDQIHDKYGNKIYAKDSEDIETPTGEFKIHISIKDDESNYQLECKPSEASNALDAAVKSITSPESASPETSAPRCRVRPADVTVAKESNFISQ